MIKNIITYPLQFILLVLLQVMVLNNIQFSSFVNPFLYILFIIWLPIDTSKLLVMTLAFFIGISVDVFTDTLGMHTSACVFLAFVRPFILSLLAPRDGYEANQKPTMNDFDLQWFLIYASLCTLLHHLFLFFVEIFTFSDFFSTLGRALASSGFTLLLIMIIQFFYYNAEARK